MSDDQAPPAPDPGSPTHAAVSRRAFLRGAGAAAAGAAVILVAPDEAGAQDGDPSVPEGTRVRRFGMVIDLRRCDGCAGLGLPPQCTQYCNWGRVVPEGMQWVEVYETPTGPPDPELPESIRGFLPAFCMQCQNAPCVNVCPVAATFHTPEGVVLIDQERCIGCRLCMAACPYDRRFFNWGEPVQPDFVRDAPYDVRTQAPAIRGTVMKCDFCMDRAAVGGLPYCIEGCPRGALYYGDLEEDVATNGTETVRLSTFVEQNHAFRYKEELGTEPRVYYIPGHGEDVPHLEAGSAQPSGHPGDSFEDTNHASAPLLQDKLEWPWRKIIEAAQQARPAAAGVGDG